MEYYPNPEATTPDKLEACKSNLTAITKELEPALDTKLNDVSKSLRDFLNHVKESIGGQ